MMPDRLRDARDTAGLVGPSCDQGIHLGRQVAKTPSGLGGPVFGLGTSVSERTLRGSGQLSPGVLDDACRLCRGLGSDAGHHAVTSAR